SPRRCGVTSVKSLLGHAKGAAGISSLIKASLVLNRRVLPPTPGLTMPHGFFDATRPWLYPLDQGEVRPRTDVLRAGVSAVGASAPEALVSAIKSIKARIAAAEGDDLSYRSVDGRVWLGTRRASSKIGFAWSRAEDASAWSAYLESLGLIADASADFRAAQ